MTVIFDVLMLVCAVEDSRYQSVSVLSLGALVAAGLALARVGGVGVVREPLLRGAVLALPFVYSLRTGEGGSGDVLGVFAVGLRFSVLRALAAVTLACAVGALALVGHTGTNRRVPFFPCLALATITVGGCA